MRNMTSTVMAGSERTRFSDAKLLQDARYSSGGFSARSTLLKIRVCMLPGCNAFTTTLQVDRWTSRRVPTFAYEFDDGTAPPIFAGPGFPPVATHSSEIQYLFDQPNAPHATPLNADQEVLAASMRRAWTNFAATGNPSAAAVPWPSINMSSNVLSLVQPQPQLVQNFAAVHHCGFWGVG
jgi:carboxylesterase type B